MKLIWLEILVQIREQNWEICESKFLFLLQFSFSLLPGSYQALHPVVQLRLAPGTWWWWGQQICSQRRTGRRWSRQCKKWTSQQPPGVWGPGPRWLPPLSSAALWQVEGETVIINHTWILTVDGRRGRGHDYFSLALSFIHLGCKGREKVVKLFTCTFNPSMYSLTHYSITGKLQIHNLQTIQVCHSAM